MTKRLLLAFLIAILLRLAPASAMGTMPGTGVLLLPDVGPAGAGEAGQLSRGHRKHGEGGAGCGPHDLELLEVLVEQQLDGLRVPDRRHAANGVTGRGAHEVGVGSRELLAHLRRDLLLAYAIRAARDYDDCLAARHAAEDDRLRDLGDRAPDGGGRIGARSRGLLELDDPRLKARFTQ